MSLETNLSGISKTSLYESFSQNFDDNQEEPQEVFSHKLSNAIHWIKDKKVSIVDNLSKKKRWSGIFHQKYKDSSILDTYKSSPDIIQFPTALNIDLWTKEGYFFLEELHFKKNQFPGNQIALINQPLLIEHLLLLDNILDSSKNFTAAHSHLIMKQALFWAKPSDQLTMNQQEIDFALSVIGKLIVAVDHFPNSLAKRLDRHEDQHLFEWLDEKISHKIHLIQKKSIELYQKHAMTGIQSPEIASRLFLVKQISQLIVTYNGFINAGIIDFLLQKTVDSENLAINYDIELSVNAVLLKNNHRIRNILNSINSISSPRAPAQLIIRSDQNGSHQDITKREPVITVLTALLSHLRQGQAGSCFATFLAINMLTTRQEDCVRDFASLIQENALIRTIDGVKIQFPYLLNIEGEEAYKPIFVTYKGKIIKNESEQAYLWEAPGIAAALTSLGFQNPKEPILKALHNLFPIPPVEGVLLEITVDKLIQNIATSSRSHCQAMLAFEAQVTNPLLRAWENAIAGMAETRRSNMLKSDSIKSTLNAILRPLKTSSPAFPKPLVELLHSYMHEAMQEQTSWQYDRSLTYKGLDRDKHSIKGGFVLFNTNNSLKLREWTRIDSAKEYQKLSIYFYKKAWKRINEQINPNALLKYQEVLKVVNHYIHSKSFLNDSIRNFHIKNQSIENPIQIIDQLKYTPWLYLGGNNPKNVIKTYLEAGKVIPIEKFSPLTAEGLWDFIIKLSQDYYHLQKRSEQTNIYLMTPVRVAGFHSFSLMLGHPSLTKIWKSGTDPMTWFHLSVIEPGLSISNSPISVTLRTSLINKCLKELVPAKYKKKFELKTASLPSKHSICEFRNALKEIFTNMKVFDKYLEDSVFCSIDTFIYHSLLIPQQKLLENNAIHFADTNWNQGANDIHLCFLVNPGNGRLEIWEATDDGKIIQALDQKTWLVYHEWEVYKPFLLHSPNLRSIR